MAGRVLQVVVLGVVAEIAGGQRQAGDAARLGAVLAEKSGIDELVDGVVAVVTDESLHGVVAGGVAGVADSQREAVRAAHESTGLALESGHVDEVVKGGVAVQATRTREVVPIHSVAHSAD